MIEQDRKVLYQKLFEISPNNSVSITSPKKSEIVNEDWWGSLFKPTFSINECQDILNLPTYDRSHSSLSLPSDDVYSLQGLQQILDNIEEDENIFRRVWRKDRLDITLKKCMSENNITAEEAIKSTYLCRDSSSQTEPCIWDSKELKIIRSCIKDFKRKNYKLEANVKNLTLKNEEVNNKNILLEKKLQKTKDTLNEALKSNERFKILTDTLASQFDESKTRNKNLLEQKTLMFNEQNNIQNKLEELKNVIILKDDKIRKQNKKLKCTDSQFKVILENSVTSVEEKCKLEIYQLQNKLDEMSSALHKERHLHRATERGFQHLLTHFPDANFEKKPPPNLKSIKYVNEL